MTRIPLTLGCPILATASPSQGRVGTTTNPGAPHLASEMWVEAPQKHPHPPNKSVILSGAARALASGAVEGPASRSARHLLLILLTTLLFTLPAHAHVGNKDVFEQINAGPYQLFVTIRTPTVIPGVATLEVRATGPQIQSLSITPVPLTGEASKHPPAADPMQPSAADPAFFTGSLWLMAPGSWQVRFEITGAAGPATASVPVPAMPLSILPMQRPLGLTLAALGLILAIGMAGIVAAAVRESRLPPGATPPPARRRRALIAAAVTLAVVALSVYAGGKWWNVEAAGYTADLFHPLTLTPTLTGNTLALAIGTHRPKTDANRASQAYKTRLNTDLLPDHGHLMHLYAIRQPGMDAVFHLHPARTATGALATTLPAMPPGTYNLYADIVHASGFPETLTATLTVPPGLPAAPLSPEDAAATPPALAAGDLGPAYKLPDGYTMRWDRPADLTAGTAYTLRFHLLDPTGKPATDMQPYLGMAGHAAFVKADGTTFAHTHPEGSAAMQAMMLANPDAMAAMDTTPLTATVGFPYGFPAPGRYRIFIQMKQATTVETGVFDAEVH